MPFGRVLLVAVPLAVLLGGGGGGGGGGGLRVTVPLTVGTLGMNTGKAPLMNKFGEGRESGRAQTTPPLHCRTGAK